MIKIYGCSDDLIEIDGDISEEFNFYARDDDDVFYLVFSDGTALSVLRDNDGIWRFIVVAVGSVPHKITPCPLGSETIATDTVEFDGGIRWVFGGRQLACAKAGS